MDQLRLWQTNPVEPIALVRGQGCRVWDSAGRCYLDLLAGTWCAALGHSHPRLVEAVCDQVAALAHIGASFTSAVASDALRQLARTLPPTLSRAVFLNTGSEAVELALKMARGATGAGEVVVIERAYYGATTYALSLSEAGRAASYLPSLGPVHRLPAPDCLRCPCGCRDGCADRFPCLDSFDELAHRDGPAIAAVIYEPVMGGGIVVPPIGYGARLRALASHCGAILLAEEVTTGMGRTGRWFGFEHENIVPDIVVIGKVVGGGLPVSIVVTTEDVEARCGGALRHVQSHQNDPLSFRIATTVMAIIEEENLVERAAHQGAYFLQCLRQLQAANSRFIREVRGRGLMLGIELQPAFASNGAQFRRLLLDEGFIIDFHAPSATFRLFPPFVISSEEIDGFIQAFGRILETAELRSKH